MYEKVPISNNQAQCKEKKSNKAKLQNPPRSKGEHSQHATL